MMRLARCVFFWLLAVAAAGPIAAAADPAKPGDMFRDTIDLAGKQVILPEGDWILAGHAYEMPPSLQGVPYGAIESIVLLKLAGTLQDTVAGFVIARRNVVPIEDGWGVAPECHRTDLLLSVVYDHVEGHSYCGFVTYVLTGVDDASDAAWRSALGYAEARGFLLPPTWVMAGFRLSDFNDVLDVRYHFNPELQGIAPSSAKTWNSSEWSRASIFGASTSTGSPSTFASLIDRVAFWRPPAPPRELAATRRASHRADLVNDVKDWLAGMRYAVEAGFNNGAAALPPVPMPWTSDDAAAPPELTLRLAALDRLRERHILHDAEYQRQRTIVETLSVRHASRPWTAAELTAVKTATDQASGTVGYFGSDLIFTGTIATASRLWALDQLLDLIRYSGQEYLWQRFGPRKLIVDEVVAFPGAGIDG